MFSSRPVRVSSVLAAGALVLLTGCGRGGPDDGADTENGSPAAEQTTEPGADRSAQTSDGSTDLPDPEDTTGRADGGSGDGGSDGADPGAEIDGLAPGATESVRVDVTVGAYVLECGEHEDRLGEVPFSVTGR